MSYRPDGAVWSLGRGVGVGSQRGQLQDPKTRQAKTFFPLLLLRRKCTKQEALSHSNSFTPLGHLGRVVRVRSIIMVQIVDDSGLRSEI